MVDGQEFAAGWVVLAQAADAVDGFADGAAG